MLLIAEALLRAVFEPFLKGSVSTSNLTEPEKGQKGPKEAFCPYVAYSLVDTACT